MPDRTESNNWLPALALSIDLWALLYSMFTWAVEGWR